jgi:DNA-binding transcriptional LysR family regulator
MDLDPRRLLTLQCVARNGGVQGAAAVLHISPSAVSQQLAALELQAGVALVDRSARSLRLTAAGQSLLAAAASIEEALDSAVAELGRRQAVVAGTVRLGSFQSAIIAIVAPALERLREQHPKLQIEVREVADSNMHRQIRTGELDLGMAEVRLGSTLPKGLAEVPLLDDPWQVVVAHQSSASVVADLVDVPWVSTFDDARADALGELAKLFHFTPRVVHRCVEYPSVLALVAAGVGAAVVPQGARELFDFARVLQLAPVRVIRAPGLGARALMLVHRSSRREPTAAVQAVIDSLLP